MSDPYYTPYPPAAADGCAAVMQLATLGAVVGGSVALARELHAVQSGHTTLGPALWESGRTAVASAVATATAGALANTVTEQGVARLGVMLASGAALLYGFHHWTQQEARHGDQ